MRLSISEAQNQLRTGHQDTRTYFYDTTEPERNMITTLATATATTATTTTDRIGPRRTGFRQRPQQTRIQPATTSTNIRRSRYQDIRNFVSGATLAVATTHNHARDANRHGRNDSFHRQYPLSFLRPSQQITATTNPGDTRHRGRSDHSHGQYFLSPPHPPQLIPAPALTLHEAAPSLSFLSLFLFCSLAFSPLLALSLLHDLPIALPLALPLLSFALTESFVTSRLDIVGSNLLATRPVISACTLSLTCSSFSSTDRELCRSRLDIVGRSREQSSSDPHGDLPLLFRFLFFF
jgi:hypothetical protein